MIRRVSSSDHIPWGNELPLAPTYSRVLFRWYFVTLSLPQRFNVLESGFAPNGFSQARQLQSMQPCPFLKQTQRLRWLGWEAALQLGRFSFPVPAVWPQEHTFFCGIGGLLQRPLQLHLASHFPLFSLMHRQLIEEHDVPSSLRWQPHPRLSKKMRKNL